MASFQPSSAVERAYGGADQTIDTPAEERALVSSFRSRADTNAKLGELPLDQVKRIYRDAMTPVYSVSDDGTITTSPSDDGATAANTRVTRHAPAPVRREAARLRAK